MQSLDSPITVMFIHTGFGLSSYFIGTGRSVRLCQETVNPS